MQEERFALRLEKLQAIREQFEETAKAISLSDSELTKNKSENNDLIVKNNTIKEENNELTQINEDSISRLQSLQEVITPIQQQVLDIKDTIKDISFNYKTSSEILKQLTSSSLELQSFIGDIGVIVSDVKEKCNVVIENINDYSALLFSKKAEADITIISLEEVEKNIEIMTASFAESVRAFSVFEDRAIQLEKETGYSVKKPNINI